MHWSLADVPRLRDRVAVVTGATSGLGLVTARALARAGATVVLATRDAARTDEVMEGLADDVPGARLSRVDLDLADLASVAAAAHDLRARHPRISLLVNNAGVMNAPRRRTADGFELHLGVNHLGHFALTAQLLAAMDDVLDPRVVTVSSSVARLGRIRFDDPNFDEGLYVSWIAYAQSKLANQVFAVELHRRLRQARSPVASIAAHPGHVATNLSTRGNDLRGGVLARVGNVAFRAMDRLTAQDAEDGALPQLFAATAPVAASGRYYGPAERRGMRGRPTEVPLVPAARDREVGRRLWELSTELTGVTWPFERGGDQPGRDAVA